MLQRHVQALLVNHAYAAVSWQVRRKDGRRDDVYLFAAMQSNDWLLGYLQALQHTQIITMTSAAILVQLLAREQEKQATALWIMQDTAGVRLSFIANGQLLFTRLLNHELDLVHEIGNTQQYLIHQQMLASSAVLPVYYPAGLTVPAEFPQLRWIPQTNDYLAMLARYPAVLNFASGTVLQTYQRARLQRWLVMITLGVAMLGLCVTGYLYQQNQQLMQQLQMLTDTRVPIVVPVDISDKRAAVNLAQQTHSTPEPMADLTWLSQLLVHYPQLQIQHVLWRSSGVLVVDGLVPMAQSDAAMTSVAAFVTGLRSETHVKAVQVQHVPVNADPHLVMHGGMVLVDAKFSLQINLRGG
jgi:hypothetical protein